MRTNTYLAAAGILLFCIAVFYPALHNGFVWDDKLFLVRSTAYSGVDRIAKSLFEPFSLYAAYYRPLVAVSFALVPPTSSIAPVVQHGINIALHAGSALLVLLAVQQLMMRREFAGEAGTSSPSRWAGISAALVYTVHPLALEPVLWVSGRFDLAFTFFALLLVYVDIARPPSRRNRVLLGTVYFCAACSKESAVVLPLSLLVIHTFLWSFDRQSESWSRYLWQRRGAYLAMPIAGMLYLALRTLAMTQLPVGNSAGALIPANGIERLLLAGWSLAEYARLVIFSWTSTAPLHLYDPLTLNSTNHVVAAVAAGASLLMLALLPSLKGWRWPYPLLLFAVTLGPVLHLISFSAAPILIADRYALAPLALSLVLGAPLLAAHIQRNPMSKIFRCTLGLIAVLILLSWVAIARVTTLVWRDDMSLWAYTYSLVPDSEMAATNYVSNLLRVGKLDEADVISKKLLERGVTSLGPLSNVALISAVRGDFDRAYETLKAVDIHKTRGVTRDDLAIYYCTLAQVDLMKGDWPAALTNSNTSLRYEPTLVSCQIAKARALHATGLTAEAIAWLRSMKSSVAPSVQTEIDQLLNAWRPSP